jgi:DNA ligase (NAD+)
MTTNAIDFLKKLKQIDKEKLLEIHGIGENIAENLIQFVNSNRYKKLLIKLEELKQKDIEINLTQNWMNRDPNLENQKLFNKVICITGTFDISRSEIQKILEKQGAIVVNTITKKTNLLIAGEEAGSKLEKATKLNIPIIYDYRNIE